MLVCAWPELLQTRTTKAQSIRTRSRLGEVRIFRRVLRHLARLTGGSHNPAEIEHYSRVGINGRGHDRCVSGCTIARWQAFHNGTRHVSRRVIEGEGGRGLLKRGGGAAFLLGVAVA